MRLPSRWVTNPGATLKAKSGPHSEVRSFFVPADMGRGCIGHPPAQGTVRPPRGREITTGLRPFAGGRECFLPLVPAHAEGAPESGRRQQDTPPGREEECTKGESSQKGGERCRRYNAERGYRGGGAGETVQGRDDAAHRRKPPKKEGEGIGEAVQKRRCRRDSAGETVQGRQCRGDSAGETVQERDDAAHREKAEPPIQGTRTTAFTKTTTYPENSSSP